MKLIYNVKDKPKFGQLIVFALQQVLAILAATIAVPAIVGHDMDPAAAMIGAGVGTIVYLLFTKFRSPVFLGSSFAFLGSMAAAFAGGVSMQLGYLGLIIGAFFAGLVYVIIAIIVKIAGVKWINKLMPAVVIGPVVALIGLSLAGNAVGDLQNVNYSKTVDVTDQVTIVEVSSEDKYTLADGSEFVLPEKAEDEAAEEAEAPAPVYAAFDKETNELRSDVVVTVDEETNEAKATVTTTPGSIYVAIICGLITLAVIIICSTYGKKMSRLIPFIIGIIAGYLAAVIFYLIGNATGNDALKVINFSAFTSLVDGGFSIRTIFHVPNLTFLTAAKGFEELKSNWAYLGTIAVAFVPVAFVVFAEHIADHKNISSIIEKDLLEDPGLHRTLLGDGVGSMVGAFFGGCPNTTYGESIGCVAITKNASISTIFCAAIEVIIVSFIAPFVAFINSIPSCVMGGVCMALYGFIAVSGLKMVQSVDLNKNKNLFVVSVILISGIGGLSLTFGKITITTIACALILGILTNLLVSKKKDDKEDAEEVENQIIK